MRRSIAWSLGTACLVAALLAARPAAAFSPSSLRPCPDHEAEQGGAPAEPLSFVPPEPAQPATDALSPAERRVVHWLVGEIHRLDGSKDLLVDFSAEDVQRATGIDVQSIDADHVRDAVRDALATDVTPVPGRSTEVVPAPDTSGTLPAPGDPETESGGPGLAD